jgi:DNA-binding MarR family transcriptional regulator
VVRENRSSQVVSEMGKGECVAPEGKHEPTSVAEVYRLVDVVSKKLTRLQREQIGRTELTPAQYSVLRLLWQRDGRQFHELASVCCCSPSTITGVVDTLEKKGLVTRQANPQDRRSLLVRLTDAGRAMELATPGLEMIFEGCCSGLARDELGQLGELLRRLNDTIPDA